MKKTGENLNDKFINIGFLKDYEGMYPPLASECEIIAIEFAVEFARWNENYPAHLKYDDRGNYLGLDKLVIIFNKKIYGKNRKNIEITKEEISNILLNEF